MKIPSELRQFEQELWRQEGSWHERRASRLRDPAIRAWLTVVENAAKTFKARWRLIDLGFTDRAALHRLHHQDGLFEKALVEGTWSDMHEHAVAVLRCYEEAAAIMEQRDDDGSRHSA
jgi:hypothetical protein